MSACLPIVSKSTSEGTVEKFSMHSDAENTTNMVLDPLATAYTLVIQLEAGSVMPVTVFAAC